MSIFSFPKYDFVTLTRPRDDIDPELKANNPDWSLQWARYIYWNWYQSRTGIKPQDVVRFERNRSYAIGRQDPNIYKDFFLGQVDQNAPQFPIVDRDGNPISSTESKRKGWVNMNFNDIFSPIPSIIQKILGIFDDQDHYVYVDAQDEKSMTLRQTMKAQSIIKSMIKDWRRANEQMLGIERPDVQEMPLPKSVEELPIFESMGNFKLPYEIAMEKLLGHTQYISDYKKIKRKVLWDLLVTGISATESSKNTVTGIIEDKWIEIEDLIVEDSVDEDFKKSSFYGIPETISMVDLKAETKNEGWTEEEYESLANAYVGLYGNPIYAGSNSARKVNIYATTPVYWYDNYRFPVLRCVVKTTDSEYYTTYKDSEKDVPEPYRKNAKGESIQPKVWNTEKKKTSKTDIRQLYKFKWIIGTEKVYDYGRFYDIPFDFKTREAILPVHVYRLPFKCFVESSILIEDMIMESILRLQNAIAKAPPQGLSIEYGSLEGMSFDNKKWSPLDVLKLYSHTGDLLYKLQPAIEGMPPNSGKPINELRGGYGTAVADALSTLELCYRQLAVATGIDQMTGVSKSPTSDQAVGVTEIAVAATTNTLKPIYTGYITIKENQSRCDALMLQSVVQTEQGAELYRKVVGQSAIEALKAAATDPPVEFGFKIMAKPSGQAIQRLLNDASAALKAGIITFSELAFIEEAIQTQGGLKYCRAYLEYKEGLRAKQEAEMANKAPVVQAQQQAVLSKQQTDDKIRIIQEQKEADIEVEIWKGIMKTKTDEANGVIQKEILKTQAEISAVAPSGEQTQKQPQTA
jgi:hypothetical protein